MEIIDKDVKFLRSIKSIDVDKLRPDAIDRSFADQILTERGLKPPVGVVYALPKPSF